MERGSAVGGGGIGLRVYPNPSPWFGFHAQAIQPFSSSVVEIALELSENVKTLTCRCTGESKRTSKRLELELY